MKRKRFLSVVLAILMGIAIMAIVTLVQHEPNPPEGEYHWSTLLRNNYGWLAVILQMVAGFALGYYFRLNAFVTGLCLIASFPIVAMVEATVYRGSHNLIPFELGMYLIFSVPATVAAYLGGLLAKKRAAA